MYAKKEKIYCGCVSKNNSNREKQVILLMIPNGEKRKPKSKGRWYYLAVKSALLRGITSKYYGAFYFINCLYSFRTKKNLNHINEYVKINIFVAI